MKGTEDIFPWPRATCDLPAINVRWLQPILEECLLRLRGMGEKPPPHAGGGKVGTVHDDKSNVAKQKGFKLREYGCGSWHPDPLPFW